MKVALFSDVHDPHAAEHPGNWNTYVPGWAKNNCSLPVDYRLKGELMTETRVGGCCQIVRLERNGVPALGVFQSTRIVGMTDDCFITSNSVYRVRVLDEVERAQGKTL